MWCFRVLILLLFILSPVLFDKGEATPPTDCHGEVFSTHVTYLYDPLDENYTHTVQNCKFDGGVTFQSTTSFAPLLGVIISMSDSTATTISLSSSLNISTGSTIALLQVAARYTVSISAAFSKAASGSIFNSTMSTLTTASTMTLWTLHIMDSLSG